MSNVCKILKDIHSGEDIQHLKNVLITIYMCEKMRQIIWGGMCSYAPWVLADTPLCVCVCVRMEINNIWNETELKCFDYILDPFTKSKHVLIRTTSRMNSDVPVVEKENTADQDQT